MFREAFPSSYATIFFQLVQGMILVCVLGDFVSDESIYEHTDWFYWQNKMLQFYLPVHK